MPVNSHHPDYAEYKGRWQRCRDAADGLESMRKAGTTYLPKLSNQDINEEYTPYLNRADWYGATARTLQGLSGAVFRKPPTVELPKSVAYLEENITNTGVPLRSFGRDVLAEILAVGRGGVYVDHTPDEAKEARPYLVKVAPERVYNWDLTVMDGKVLLTRVVMEEKVEKLLRADDPFLKRQESRFRVLQVDPDTGIYSVEVWEKVEGKDEYKRNDELTVYPHRRGTPLNDVPEIREQTGGGVPFWFTNPGDVTPEMTRPPLMDMVDTNISLWRNSADMENGLHFCGIPQPWAAGFPTDGTFIMGSRTAWVTSKEGAKASLLEFTGQGLGALSGQMDSKKADLAVMGARLLEGQKRAAETAETVKLRQSGEQSTLIGMVDVTEAVLNAALKVAAIWAGASGKVEFGLNRDLIGIKGTPQELQTLTAALQEGAISFETYYYNLEQMELTRPGVNAEDELETIRGDEENILQLRSAPTSDADDDKDRADKKVEQARAS